MGTLKKTEGKGELMNAGGQLHQEGVNKVVSKKRGNGQSCTLQEDNYFLVRYFKKMFPTSNTRVLVYLSCVEFFAACVIAIQAPFYPEVARDKGATAAESGIVFGSFELTVFIMSPIIGAKMEKLKPRRVFNWGILTAGACCIIFGLLDAIENRTLFILSCLVVRAVEAVGAAAFDTASFTIIAIEFPNSVATSFGILEICYGLGLIIGPTLGGALYQIGGYRTPFFTMGGCLFVSAMATHYLLPEPKCKDQEVAAGPGTRGGFEMFRMLKIPVIAITAYSIVGAAIGVGFLSANLEYHLTQFHLNKVSVGAVFVMSGGVYAITAPAWGWICDNTKNQKLITFSGALFTILGYAIIGPVPFLPFETILPLSCFGLALFGLGLAATLVSAFLQFLNDAIVHGYPDDISTYGLVSGLWTSMCALGYFIGPTAGGMLVDMFGFRWASLFVIGGQLILILMLVAYSVSRDSRASSWSFCRCIPDDAVATTDLHAMKKPNFHGDHVAQHNFHEFI